MTKRELLLSPNYTCVLLNGRKLIKHENYLHSGNYYSKLEEGININDLKNSDVIERV